MGHVHIETHTTLLRHSYSISLSYTPTLSSFESHNAKCKCKRQRGRTDQIKTARSVVRLHLNLYSSPASHVICAVLSTVLFFFSDRPLYLCLSFIIGWSLCKSACKKVGLYPQVGPLLRSCGVCLRRVCPVWGEYSKWATLPCILFITSSLSSFICSCCLPFHYVITNVDGDFQFSFGNYLEVIWSAKQLFAFVNIEILVKLLTHCLDCCTNW